MSINPLPLIIYKWAKVQWSWICTWLSHAALGDDALVSSYSCAKATCFKAILGGNGEVLQSCEG